MTQQLETEVEVGEDCGIDVDNLGTVQSRMWDDQQSFLGNYAKDGAVE